MAERLPSQILKFFSPTKVLLSGGLLLKLVPEQPDPYTVLTSKDTGTKQYRALSFIMLARYPSDESYRMGAASLQHLSNRGYIAPGSMHNAIHRDANARTP